MPVPQYRIVVDADTEQNPCATADPLPNGDDDLVIHRDSDEDHVDEADSGLDHAPHQAPAEGSRWQTILKDVSQYLAGLNPVSSGRYGLGTTEWTTRG